MKVTQHVQVLNIADLHGNIKWQSRVVRQTSEMVCLKLTGHATTHYPAFLTLMRFDSQCSTQCTTSSWVSWFLFFLQTT